MIEFKNGNETGSFDTKKTLGGPFKNNKEKTVGKKNLGYRIREKM